MSESIEVVPEVLIEVVLEVIPEVVIELVFVDLCLKFTDKEQAIEVLSTYYALMDVVGTIYKSTGNIIEDNPEMAPIDGWHVNLRGTLTTVQVEALTPFIVVPQSPVRVWA